MGYKIMLDRGHFGKNNRSPVVKEYYESERMWVLGGFLKDYLIQFGFTVGDTRTDPDKDLAVVKRGEMAKGYDLFLSLHSDAAGDNKGSTVSRVSVFGAYDNLNNSWDLGAKLADAVAKAIGVPESYIKTRKSEKGNWEYYGVLRGARSVGCPLYYIIEHSFHTNEYVARWLMSDDNLKQVALVEAMTIARYFGLLKEGDINGDGKINSKDYMLAKRIVLGTYNPTEAEKIRADVNGDGKVNAKDYTLIKRDALGTFDITEKE